MTLRTCSLESEILQALKVGCWPDGCAPELRAHVESCGSCSDLVLVTQTFQSARHQSVQRVPGGSAGLIWWRAQIRRRNAAAERVSRPIDIAQIFALAVNLLVAVAFVASQYRHGIHWASWWTRLSSHWILHPLSSIASANWNLLLAIPGLGVLVLLTSVVLYVVSEKS